MPRIYKPVGPSSNKAVTPVKETKTTPPKDDKKDDKKPEADGV
jgi:hypothetical protein